MSKASCYYCAEQLIQYFPDKSLREVAEKLYNKEKERGRWGMVIKGIFNKKVAGVTGSESEQVQRTLEALRSGLLPRRLLRRAFLRGIDKELRQAVKEQRRNGVIPTVDSLTKDILQNNKLLQLLKELNIEPNYIKAAAKAVI